MEEIASISRRIATIKRLAKSYYKLDKGTLIESHSELLRVFDIRGSIHEKSHPHRMKRIYISRKSLKHFVESRKEELEKNNTPEKAVELICFALDELQEVVTNFTSYTFEPLNREINAREKHFYIKDYSNIGKPAIRVCLEMVNGKLEIFSIHFTKNRKIEK